MICVVADISRLDLCKAESECACFPFLRELISTGKNKNVKRERIGAYLTLKLAYTRIWGTSLPELFRDDFGKVHFLRGDDGLSPAPSFSISHSGDMCAVLFLNSNHGCGVDIEKCVSQRPCEKLTKRHLENVNNYLQSSQVCKPRLIYASLNESGNNFDIFRTVLHDGKERDEILEVNNESCSITADAADSLPFSCYELRPSEYSFYNKWTALEAVLKADGRGFSSFSHADMLFSRASVCSYILKTQKNEFSLSCVLLNEM